MKNYEFFYIYKLLITFQMVWRRQHPGHSTVTSSFPPAACFRADDPPRFQHRRGVGHRCPSVFSQKLARETSIPFCLVLHIHCGWMRNSSRLGHPAFSISSRELPPPSVNFCQRSADYIVCILFTTVEIKDKAFLFPGVSTIFQIFQKIWPSRNT